MFASSGDATEPCGVPVSGSDHLPSSITPAFSHFWISRRIRRSATRCSTNWSNQLLSKLWRVGTSLRAVAFAEPCQSVSFETVASPSRHDSLYSSPHLEPGVQISRTGLPNPHSLRSPLGSCVTGRRIRQFEPRTALEVTPEQPVTLAASAQHPNPLQNDLAPYSVQSRLAMM